MRSAKLGAVALLAMCGSAVAGPTIDLDAVDRGWYDEQGDHTPGNLNYIVGRSAVNHQWHNWFVFDLSSVAGQVQSLSLTLTVPAANGYRSPDPSETYEMFDVTTDLDDLVNGTGGLGAFNDLASGVSYGTHVYTNSDRGLAVTMTLNAAAVADANSAGAGLFAIGGVLTTLDSPGEQESVFGNSGDVPLSGTQLNVTIPAPASLALMPAAALFGRRRRRQSVPADSR
jgi:hypothetical protein